MYKRKIRIPTYPDIKDTENEPIERKKERKEKKTQGAYGWKIFIWFMYKIPYRS